MKTTYYHTLLTIAFLVVLFPPSLLKVYGQDTHFLANIKFETNAHLIHIDSTQINNIWQIGTPSKTYFDSAFSTPFAIVTDTLNYYPPKNLSSFDVRIIPPPNSCWGTGQLGFLHKYDTRPGIDGCWIDVRYDADTAWTNILFDEDPEEGISFWDFYEPTDTLSNGTPAFSGTSEGWVESGVYWVWQIGVKYYFHDSLTIRFNFMSEDGEPAHEGWMIDDIYLWLLDCTGGIDDGESLIPEITIVPNPVTDVSVMRFKDVPEKDFTVCVYNMYGQLVKQITGTRDLPIFIYRQEFTDGYYLYQVLEKETMLYSGKFVVNK
jgi:hypothetical protein